MDFKETDKLVTVFSEDQGKLRAIAKGVKKPNSSLRACVQPFCCSQLFFNGGKELEVITQGRLLDFYGNCRQDINMTLYIMYMMELLDKSLMDKVPLPALFTTAIEVLEFFNNKGFNILAIRYFEMMLLINLGYQPVVDRCVSCGRKEITAAGFDLSAGGMLCRQCLHDTGHFIQMNGETIALAKLLAAGRLTAITRVKVSPPALHQLEIFLEKYMEYHLERKFYMKNTIVTLKRTMGIPD
jgi:DNA repair protein RecO (recombination protein O)